MMKSIVVVAFLFISSLAGAEEACMNRGEAKSESELSLALTVPLPECSIDAQCPGRQKCLAGRCVGGLVEQDSAGPLAANPAPESK